MTSSKTLDGSFVIIELEERPPSYNDDSKQQQQFPLNIDGVVNPDMLDAHLALLMKFKELEQSDEEMEDQKMPIPPLDVCLIWHAHCLSPLRYYEDMLRLHDPQKHDHNFPLAQLATELPSHALYSGTPL
ncbi:2737_t:CDS:2 [Ambispora gerdemannii]|uniref:2737_t:CDS:1 n=1 Tax=Ambispora gerdemannii TaxID=144530 RepID=A0A9N9FNM7_9GLOM|nr:2737_t:CDS:2 [Ambispora gerdemannii]